MLPLIPALILLLLQGPSNVEALAHEGRLPAALDAVHRSLSSCERHSPEREALAQLLAASGDVSLSRALAQILTLVADEPSKSAEPKGSSDVEPGPPAPRNAARHLETGFLRSQRTRDGPLFGYGF